MDAILDICYAKALIRIRMIIFNISPTRNQFRGLRFRCLHAGSTYSDQYCSTPEIGGL